MKTKILSINQSNLADLDEAAQLLRAGEVVGFPTETVYGLGGSAFSERAIQKIFDAKNRPADNPLIVHISNIEMLNDLVEEVSEFAKKIMDEFWPGPLTILFNKNKNNVPDIVTAGLNTVAVRMPSHPIARALIEKANLPIAAPSANLSGSPSPTTAQHVFDDLNGRIPMIVDGGKCEIGVESTVIDIYRNPPLILRPGGATFEKLREIIPNIEIYEKITPKKELEERPSTPGLKYRHYSPRARVFLFEHSSILEYLQNNTRETNVKMGIIHTNPLIEIQSYHDIAPNLIIKSAFRIDDGARASLSEKDQAILVAQEIFTSLRYLDEENVTLILIEGISEKYMGLAVMNRIRKAASEIL